MLRSKVGITRLVGGALNRLFCSLIIQHNSHLLVLIFYTPNGFIAAWNLNGINCSP